jgi:hypothetical protein
MSLLSIVFICRLNNRDLVLSVHHHSRHFSSSSPTSDSSTSLSILGIAGSLGSSLSVARSLPAKSIARGERRCDIFLGIV